MMAAGLSNATQAACNTLPDPAVAFAACTPRPDLVIQMGYTAARLACFTRQIQWRLWCRIRSWLIKVLGKAKEHAAQHSHPLVGSQIREGAQEPHPKHSPF